MFRVRLIVAGAAIGMGAALAGCSGTSLSMPEWLKPSPTLQPLQFESQPPGADVRTAQGQTCRTPCSLALPLTNQSVTFAMNGYAPQTVPIEVRQSVDNPLAPAEFSPNPVGAALQPLQPPKKPGAKPHKQTAARTRTAARSAAPVQSPGADPFPAPPPAQPSTASPFPPPPQAR